MSTEIIPYTIEEREDTGVNNAKLGIWLFLTSEVMLFGALFSTYIFLRVGTINWPVGSSFLNVPMAALNTVFLITSSITMVMAWLSLVDKNFSAYRKYMLFTILLGCAFLVVKYFEYTAKFEHHLYPSTNTFLALYFTMTGLHVLHVIGGLIVNIYFLFPGSKMWESNPERFKNRIEIAGLYWHFVDLVWIFLFPVLYLS
ncbi:MAG: heme-copper oxidase subunit III [Ignavibacteria bacterium]|nr:heme-copper oxidase subunit III [Ignavibacteria bacterium]